MNDYEFELYCKDANLQPLQDGTFKRADGTIHPLIAWRLNVKFLYEVYFLQEPVI